MLVYWLLLAGSVVIGYPLCKFKIKFGKEIFCVLAGLALFFVAGVRRFVGYDYYSYSGIYMSYHTLDIIDIGNSVLEKGFAVPVKLLTDISLGYQPMFFIIAFIFAAAVMIYVYKKSDAPYLSVFCLLAFGYYFNSMNFMRQVIAALVMLYAMQYIEKKQFLRFAVFTLFATVFHISAFIMLIFYFVLKIKMNYITLGVYSVCCVVFFIYSWDFMEFITQYIYKGYSPETNMEMKMGLNPVYTTFFGVFFLIAFLLRKPLVAKDPENNTLINCMYFTFFFEMCGTRHAIISRFSLLFMLPAILVLIPRVILLIIEKCDARFKNRKKGRIISKAAAITLFFAVCSGMYAFMLTHNYNGVMPYRTVLTREASK